MGTYLGFKSSAAEKEAGKWIVAASSGGPAAQETYGFLCKGLTVASATSALDLVSVLGVLPETTVRGHEVIGVQGRSTVGPYSGNETIYVAATGRPLPVAIQLSVDGVVEYTTFGSWGRPPAARAPKHAVALKGDWLSYQ